MFVFMLLFLLIIFMYHSDVFIYSFVYVYKSPPYYKPFCVSLTIPNIGFKLNICHNHDFSLEQP